MLHKAKRIDHDEWVTGYYRYDPQFGHQIQTILKVRKDPSSWIWVTSVIDFDTIIAVGNTITPQGETIIPIRELPIMIKKKKYTRAELGSAIRKLRKAKGITTYQLVYHLNVHSNTTSKIELPSKKSYNIDTLLDYLNKSEISLTELANEIDTPQDVPVLTSVKEVDLRKGNEIDL